MRIIHFCAGLEGWNGMANTARQFVREEIAAGHDSKLCNSLAEIVRGVDRVHIHGAWLPILHQAARKARRMGAEVVVRPAGSYDPVRRAFHGWRKWLMAPWEHAMLNRADCILATCAAEADWIRTYHPKAHIELTDLKRFFKIPEYVESPYHGESRLSVGRSLHVLYLGRLHPLKGVGYLEEAVHQLNALTAQMPECLGRKCIELKVVSDVYGDELERVWQWCDVLCLPTLSENFGRVVAEALEHGRPVITTDGAPVWSDLNEGQGHYLKGFRDGSDEVRVRLLSNALMSMVGSGSDERR